MPPISGMEPLSSRIGYVGTPPPPEHHSSATISNIEALGEKERVLQCSMEPIRARFYDEEQALEFILKELREYQGRQERTVSSSLATIRQYRNLLVPVARLPPEILSHIFVFNAQMALPEMWTKAACTSSYVCKRWREIALDCPELWSHIRCHNKYDIPLSWLKTIIKRSRSVPLYLIGSGMEMTKEALALVSNNMSRLKSIDLHFSDKIHCDAGSLFKAFSQPVPILQHLTVTLDPDYRDSTFTFPPRTFLGGSAPNLRHMKLTVSTYVAWNSRLFENLTTLEIKGHRSHLKHFDTNLESLEMLLDALTKMPGLELLVICDCIPSLAYSGARCAHVDLPNLKRFELTDSLNHCTDLLGQITINPSATLLLNPSCLDTTMEDISRFLRVFPSQLWATSPPTETLNFTRKCGDDFKIDMQWPVQQESEVMHSGNASATVIFRVRHNNFLNPSRMARACFAAFASPQLRSFRISGAIFNWDVGIWREVACMAPELRSLAVGGPMQAGGLCRALCSPDGLDPVLADCCFPALTHLELAARYNHPLLTPGGGKTLLSAVLPQFLAARAAIGCSTPELVFIVPPSEESAEGWSVPFKEAIPGINVRERHELGWEE